MNINIIVIVIYIIGNVVCFPLIKYSPLKSSKRISFCLKSKSKQEIELENKRELIRLMQELALKEKLEMKRIEDSKYIEMEKILAMQVVEEKKINAMKEVEEHKIAVEEHKIAVEERKIAVEEKKINATKEVEEHKIAVEAKKAENDKVDSEKERKFKTVLAVVFVIAILIFGGQLKDGLLGRVTTFNSILNELKEGILQLTKTVQVLVGGMILDKLIKKLVSIRTFFFKLFRR